MKTRPLTRALAVGAALCAMLITTAAALAHESRDVGKYRFTVGFIVEPPIEGEKNGVELRIIDSGTQQPVEGVEKTLKVEVTHVPTNVSKTYDLRTIFRDPGHYTTDLILTAPGHYRMRFFGTVEGAQVNETFNSRTGGGNFDDVQASTGFMFPQAAAQPREIEGAVKGAQAAAQQAQQTASQAQQEVGSASSLAMIGLALGVIGTALGASALFVASRKR